MYTTPETSPDKQVALYQGEHENEKKSKAIKPHKKVNGKRQRIKRTSTEAVTSPSNVAVILR